MSDLKSQCTTSPDSSVALAADLSCCIQRNEVFPVFQPVVSLLTGRAVGCEVLLRWRHPSPRPWFPPPSSCLSPNRPE